MRQKKNMVKENAFSSDDDNENDNELWVDKVT